MKYLILLVLFFQYGLVQDTNNIKQLIKKYENNINSSLRLEKEDRNLINTWTTEFQLKRINITTKYRLQMIKHKEHSFKRSNPEWVECVHHHKRPIRKSFKEYIGSENACLNSTIEDGKSLNDVKQLEREIKKWRKGYRYLLNTCRNENPNDFDAAEICFVQFMEKDNYNKVINRLIILKLEAMKQLYLYLEKSINNLEECLKNQLSVYLEKIRLIMDALNKCYELKTKNLKEM